MKTLLSIILIIINAKYAFSQNSNNLKYTQIDETISTIKKSELSTNWKLFTKDTLNPTSIKIDLDGDNKVDFCGFFKGIEQGLMIFGDVENNSRKLYQLDFDSTWFKNERFQAIMLLKKKGQTIRDMNSGKVIKLKENSIYIKKFDGTEFTITMINNEFIKIITK